MPPDNTQNLMRLNPIQPVERLTTSPSYIQGGLQGGQVQLGNLPDLPAKSKSQLQYENLAAIAGAVGQSIDIFGKIVEDIDKKTIQKVEAEFNTLDADETLDPREKYERFNAIVARNSTFISGDTWKATIQAQAKKRFGSKEALNQFAIERYQEDAFKSDTSYSGKLDDEVFNQNFLPRWAADNPSLEDVPAIQLMRNGLVLADRERQRKLGVYTAVHLYKDAFSIPEPVRLALANGSLTIDQAMENKLVTPEAREFFKLAENSASFTELKAQANAQIFADLSTQEAFRELTPEQIKDIVIESSEQIHGSLRGTFDLIQTQKVQKRIDDRKTQVKIRMGQIDADPSLATIEEFKELVADTDGLASERMALVGVVGSSLWERVMEESRGTDDEENYVKLQSNWNTLVKEVFPAIGLTPQEFGLEATSDITGMVASQASVGEGQTKQNLAEFFDTLKYRMVSTLTEDAVANLENSGDEDPKPAIESAVLELFRGVGGLSYQAMPKAPYRKLRGDGTVEGNGYFGPLKDPKGNIVTEYPLLMRINTESHETVEIPALVPTLTPEEVNQVLEASGLYKSLPVTIREKAEKHARERIQNGQSPFADSTPNVTPVPEQREIDLNNYTADFTELILSPASSMREKFDKFRDRLAKDEKLDDFEKYLGQKGFGVKLDMELVRQFVKLGNDVKAQARQNEVLNNRQERQPSERGSHSVVREMASFVSKPNTAFEYLRKRERGELDPANPSDQVALAALSTIESKSQTTTIVTVNESLMRDSRLSNELGFSPKEMQALANSQLIPLAESGDRWGARKEALSKELGVTHSEAYDMWAKFNKAWTKKFHVMYGSNATIEDSNYFAFLNETDDAKPSTVLGQIKTALAEGNEQRVNALIGMVEFHFNLAFQTGVPISDPSIAQYQEVFGSWLRVENLGQIFEQAETNTETRAQAAITLGILRATTSNNTALRFWGDDSQIDAQYMTVLGRVLRNYPSRNDPRFIQDKVKLTISRLVSAGQASVRKLNTNIPEELRYALFGPPGLGRDQRMATQSDMATLAVTRIREAPNTLPYLLSGDLQSIRREATTTNESFVADNVLRLTKFLETSSGISDPNNPTKDLSIGEFFGVSVLPPGVNYNNTPIDEPVTAIVTSLRDSMGEQAFSMFVQGLVAFNFPADSSQRGTPEEVTTGAEVLVQALAKIGYFNNTQRRYQTVLRPDGSVGILSRTEDRLPNPTSGQGFKNHLNGVTFTGSNSAAPTGLLFTLPLPPEGSMPDLGTTIVGRGDTFHFERFWDAQVFESETTTPLTAREYDEKFQREIRKYQGIEEEYGVPAIPQHLQPPLAHNINQEQGFLLSTLALPASTANFEYVLKLMPHLKYLPYVYTPGKALEHFTTIENADYSTEEFSIPQKRPDSLEKPLKVFLNETKQNPEDSSIFDFIRWLDRKNGTSTQVDILEYCFDPEETIKVSPSYTHGEHILSFTRNRERIIKKDINLSEIDPPQLSQARRESQKAMPTNTTVIQQRAMLQRVFRSALQYQHLALQEKQKRIDEEKKQNGG